MPQGKDSESVREQVREGYARIAQADVRPRDGGSSSSGCGCCGEVVDPAVLARSVGYSEADLAALPEGANMGLCCGNPTAIAALKSGEVVLDLGSGGGFDVFLAGPRVGPTGRVIGVDMTPDMRAKARGNVAAYRERSGLDNVEFRLGEIEHLPVADASVDVVISNCVINLSPDKPQVFREVFRVLKPGGKMMVSDIVLNRPFPESLRDDEDLYAACLAGALLREDYLGAIRAAGFGLVEVITDREYEASSVCDDPITEEVADALEGVSSSITVMAVK